MDYQKLQIYLIKINYNALLTLFATVSGDSATAIQILAPIQKTFRIF